MHPTRQEAETGGVHPSDVVAGQSIDALEVDAQVIDGTGPGRVMSLRIDDREFDPVAQRLHDPSGVARVEAAFEGVSTYNVQPGWWEDMEPGRVEAHARKLPDALLDLVRQEAAEALHRAEARWHGACRSNGGVQQARREGFRPVSEDRAARHARSVLLVIQSEQERRR